MDYDFNSSLYGSDGSTVLSGSQASTAQKADNAVLNGFLSLIGAGASAYATVKAAEAPKTTAQQASGPGKTSAPVIGLAGESPALTSRAKVIIGGAIAAVVLVIGVLLFRRK